MYIYGLALKEVEKKIDIIRYDYEYFNKYDSIDHVMTRIKSPESILNKLKKDEMEPTYKNLVSDINDVAGIRIICPLKSDIFTIRKYIREFNDINVINNELARYNDELIKRPQVIAANKCDVFYGTEEDTVISLLKEEFEPNGIKVFPISAVSGKGVKELLYYVKSLLDEMPDEPTVFEKEFSFDEMEFEDEPYTVTYDEKNKVYNVEGPRIEKMLGYTNLDSEKGFQFFQKFLKTSGILDDLEAMGIEEGDTVAMYDLQFDYYK